MYNYAIKLTRVIQYTYILICVKLLYMFKYINVIYVWEVRAPFHKVMMHCSIVTHNKYRLKQCATKCNRNRLRK